MDRPWQLDWLCGLLLVFFVALFTLNSLTRTRQFPYDAMNYADVARHVAQGEGLVQTTVGMFQPRLTSLPTEGPVPFVAQAPLFPLLVAGLNRIGIGIEDGALTLSLLGYLGTLALGTLLALWLYGPAGARLTLAALLICAPLAQAGRTALTEALALAFLLGSLAMAVRGRSDLGAGALAGLAFAARYALSSWLLVGLLWVLWKRRGRGAVLFALGAALPSVPVPLHNFQATGTLLPRPLPSDQGLVQNLRDGVLALLGNIFITDRVQPLQALALLAFLVLVFLRRRHGLRLSHLPRRSDFLLLVGALLYEGGLIVQRSLVHFDPLDSRLLLPAIVPLLLLAGNLTARPHRAAVALCLALGLALVREGKLFLLPVEEPALLRSPRLAWLAANTAPEERLLGDDAMDVPFFLGRRRVFSFSAYPYNEPPDAAFLQKLAPVVIVVRPSEGTEKDARYGPILAALKQGNPPRELPITPLAELSDARIYRFEARP